MSVARALLVSMRPRQWTKNLIVAAPAIFAGRLLDPATAWRVAAAFALMCLASGAVYLLNDVRDAPVDAAHPTKRSRPVASGGLSARIATSFALVLLALVLCGAFALGLRFTVAVIGFVGLQLTYSLWLKHVPVLDVAAITAGFVIRAVGGAAAAGVPDSPWLLASSALLVVFLVLGKRRQELCELGEGAASHRRVLGRYTRRGVEAALVAVTAVTVATYLVYALLAAAPGPRMVVTVPFVCAGLLRYLYLARSGESRPAEELLLTDPPLIASIALWLVSVILVVHGG